MKATIDRQELLAALGRALAVAREHALHAKSVELRALRSCLTIIGTDLDTWVICDLRSEGEAGRVVVDGSRIAAFAAAADTEEIELSSTKAGLRVSAGRAAIVIPLLGDAVTDLPVVDGADVSCDGTIFARVVRATAHAVSREETRRVLMGVLLGAVDDSIRAVATNGHYLAIAAATAPNAGSLPPRIVPPEALKALPQGDGEVVIAAGASHALFRCGTTHVITRTIDGTYPDWERVVPTDGGTECVLPRVALLDALSRAKCIARDNMAYRVRLVVKGSGVELSTVSVSGDFVERLDAAVEGEATVEFNAEYLRTILAHTAGERVRLVLRGAERPITLLPDTELAREEYILMPLRPA